MRSFVLRCKTERAINTRVMNETTAPVTETEALERIVLVTGMSGAGHTTALKALEDIGFEAVDNLPMRLLPGLVRQGPAPGRGLAVGVDVRTRDFGVDALVEEVTRLKHRASYPVEVLFLDCDDEVLRRRYTETRRRHPLAEDRPVLDGIAQERRMLALLRDAADTVIDTSHSNVHEFAQQVRDHVGGAVAGKVQLFIKSFAYRHGLPRDSDLVFDVRFLRNPHYEEGLRPLSGRDAAVARFIEADEAFGAFFDGLTSLLGLLLPRYDREGKSYLTIAIGCTGGRHRSVYIAERLAAWSAGDGYRARVQHRDLAMEPPPAGTGREAS